MLYLFLILVVIMGFAVFFGPPYVPTHRKQLEKLFKYLNLTGDDVLLDLGSGDGVVLREASKYIKKGIGYELNPILVLIANILNMRYSNIKSHCRNYLRADFPDGVTIFYVFTVDKIIDSLEKKIKQYVLTHGKRILIISYGFRFHTLELVEEKFGFYIYKI